MDRCRVIKSLRDDISSFAALLGDVLRWNTIAEEYNSDCDERELLIHSLAYEARDLGWWRLRNLLTAYLALCDDDEDAADDAFAAAAELEDRMDTLDAHCTRLIDATGKEDARES